MRVVAGTARGQRLFAPPGSVTRPTPDRVREAVFNSLYSLGTLAEARVLDLYAGTGAMGIEALSRGAGSAVFVERSPRAVSALRSNLESTSFTDRATVVADDVDRFLDGLVPTSSGRDASSVPFGPARAPERVWFDLAVVDPPYRFDGWAELLPRLPVSMVIIESNREVVGGGSLRVHRCKRYGSTVVTLASTARAGPESVGS